MEFKELSIEEMVRGYTENPVTGSLRCVFCCEVFERGLIYTSRGRTVTAERAAEEHMLDEHDGAFYGMLRLGKAIHGLSESQQDILEGMYLEKDNRELGEEMGISAATVRTHKFNIQRMKREAKILLAMLEQIENTDMTERRKHLLETDHAEQKEFPDVGRGFTGNRLHPFFSQFDLK
ncbi:LuxR C-terminal-related transcriptional regulator [Oscillospiraceae bacterium 50-60]